MSRFRVVCVLGMHRSGTSVLARAMSALGIQLGEDLLDPEEHNPKGFFEDRGVLQLNEELLARIGRQWSSVGVLDDGALAPSRHEVLFERAIELLSDRTSHFPVWGFKDPRTANLLPFWREAFNTLGLRVAYLISIRNPLSVAKSLAVRDDFPDAWSLIMWLQHCCACLRNTAGESRLVVDYDLLMSDPEAQLGRMAGFMGESLDGCSRELIDDFCTEFLDKDLRHTRFTARDVRDLRPSIPCLAEAFDLVSGLARDDLPDSRAEGQLLEAVTASLESSKAMLDLLDTWKGRADRLKQEALVVRAENAAGAAQLASALENNAVLAGRIARLTEIEGMVLAKSKTRWRSWLRDLILFSPLRAVKSIHCALAILKDGSFDVKYYLERNIDVAISGVHPLAHYILYGAKEGRDPSPDFKTSFYMEQNRDVADSGINPLFHYVRQGRKEGRSPSPERQSPE